MLKNEHQVVRTRVMGPERRPRVTSQSPPILQFQLGSILVLSGLQVSLPEPKIPSYLSDNKHMHATGLARCHVVRPSTPKGHAPWTVFFILILSNTPIYHALE